MANRYADRYAKLKEAWMANKPKPINTGGLNPPSSSDVLISNQRDTSPFDYGASFNYTNPIPIPRIPGQSGATNLGRSPFVPNPLSTSLKNDVIDMGIPGASTGISLAENVVPAQAAIDNAVAQPSPFKEIPGAFGLTNPGSVPGSSPVPGIAPGMISQELSPQAFGMGRLATPGTLADLRAKFKNREQGYGVRS